MMENTGREFPPRPIIGIGAVIVGEKGVVLIKRGKAPRLGSWSLPGGAAIDGQRSRKAVDTEL
jgi:ADP-ribose pyrophosphatase YjhB (NUDIX family)